MIRASAGAGGSVGARGSVSVSDRVSVSVGDSIMTGAVGWAYPVAIAAAVLVVMGALKRTTLGERSDARPHPAPTTPVPLPMPPTHEETAQEKAQKLREMALVDAQKGYLGHALDDLAAANVLDRGGAYSKAAVDAWMAIQAEKATRPNYATAPSGPDERPLIGKSREKHPLSREKRLSSREQRLLSREKRPLMTEKQALMREKRLLLSEKRVFLS